jgi:hypothetical protein
LPHQVKAVASIANVFESIDFMPVTGLLKDVANPQYANIPYMHATKIAVCIIMPFNTHDKATKFLTTKA